MRRLLYLVPFLLMGSTVVSARPMDETLKFGGTYVSSGSDSADKENRQTILQLERDIDSLDLLFNRMRIDTYLRYSDYSGNIPAVGHFRQTYIDSLQQHDKAIARARRAFVKENEVLIKILDDCPAYSPEMEQNTLARLYDSLKEASSEYRVARQRRDQALWYYNTSVIRALRDNAIAKGEILPLFFVDETTNKWMYAINPKLEMVWERLKALKERLKQLYSSEASQVYGFEYRRK